VLDVEYNNINVEGARVIAEMLEVSQGLISLNLSNE
jgi:hypothetical protein